MVATTAKAEIIRNAVHLACRAPSLHNSQPWQWLAGPGTLQLFLDPTRILDYDQSRREALIGCGAALDHLRVAMTAGGWHTHINRFPTPDDPNHLASLDFTPMDQVTDDDRHRADAILMRRSDRLPFEGPTGWESFEPVLRSVVGTDTVRLDVLPDELRPQLAEASQTATALRLYDTAYHVEIGWWTGAFRLADGIPDTSLVSAGEADRVDVGRYFPVTHGGERRIGILEDHAKIVLLSTDADGRADALASGEALSEVLLECTMAGLATCTLTHITEVRTTRELVAELMGYDGQPQVLIRVGVAPALENLPPVTPRRPLDNVFVVQS
ncbi:Acg family FMN-binding oxidoreductase [Mycobacterium sp.]|uniref:Acg family FMN-binding oxidoreductase n=1 Tax=Mycobacterium sp. TaxID=1785 RepID=UPI003F94E62F